MLQLANKSAYHSAKALEVVIVGFPLAELALLGGNYPAR